MKDPIERADATETFAELYDIFDDCPTIVEELHKVYDKILAIPSAEKHGKWMFVGNTHDIEPIWKCSECGENEFGSKSKLTNFCPNCGADMKGADDE